MFNASTYLERRKILKQLLKKGVILLTGNNTFYFDHLSPHHFRQDSSFMYYFGLQDQGLAAIIDIDENREIIFGDERSVGDIIWMGTDRTIAERAQEVGITEVLPLVELENYTTQTLKQHRKVHYLPQVKFENILAIEKLLGIHHASVNKHFSIDFIHAMVAQRSIKSDEEVLEIESALDISYGMNKLAMQMIKPGMYERDIAGAVEGLALSLGNGISFPVIFSINGHILHNHAHGNLMKDGDITVLDSGAYSNLHYASDITRVIPVSGKFTERQKEIYNVVFDMLAVAKNAIEPGKAYRDVHLLAAKACAVGLKDLGLMKGDPNEAVAAGAHALFFPHGLGHMLGLDVHDMEDIGETFVGYDDEFIRSKQFGLAYLRLARRLEPGFVITVEPGCYFIPQLIDQWKAENKFTEFINYEKVEEYKNFGGIRLEDDVLITHSGKRVLGTPIPLTVEEVENTCKE